jgi:hypothetical protein
MLPDNRLLTERSLDGARRPGDKGQPARTVSVNMAESPLGWLHARGHISDRQRDAGEQLRSDWERAQLSPRVTMRWDPAPVSQRGGGRAPAALQPAETQMKAKERFDAALAEAGSGLSDILWRVVCSGEGMRDAETALGWPARAGKLVLTIALDRIADYYRLR